ncbi:MAG: ABC transporter ATP-binding protein [Flavobacteriaceae bacterium]|nr:ABC transporter ATP-binding protein [Flavobacteriaceae bacterium]
MLKVKDISISFPSKNESIEVVKKVSFQLQKSQILGVVGESGSGKSMTSLALMGLLPKEAHLSGAIEFKGEELTSFSEKQWQKIRGNTISMIFQEPMSSLNPSLTCGYQVAEILFQHYKGNKKEVKQQVLSLFEQVKLPQPDVVYNKYPHQLSGGQQQRIMIAMAIACQPDILIADEPTTALDVTVQKEIILLLKELQQQSEMSIIFISHDLSLVSEIADEVLVMHQGNIVEQGTTKEVFFNPKEIYTKALIHSRPPINKRLESLPTVQDYMSKTVDIKEYTAEKRAEFHKGLYSKPPLLEVKNLSTFFTIKKGFLGQKNTIKAVNDVSFELYEGETMGLVGESGCGKTTLGRSILHLEKTTQGTIFYRQKDVTNLSGSELKKFRREVQIIFQDPFSSLNPRMMVGEAIMEPMEVHKLYKNAKERKEKALFILEKVGLTEDHFYRYPHEFSGGQRQRIGIARTIALQPKLIICDESVSALDVSVQAQVLNLLNELKRDFGFTYIFISHDLAVVKYMSDYLLVMNKGKIEERGESDALYENPQKEYTQKLIDAIPKGI